MRSFKPVYVFAFFAVATLSVHWTISVGWALIALVVYKWIAHENRLHQRMLQETFDSAMSAFKAMQETERLKRQR